jgi:hypothetical protein
MVNGDSRDNEMGPWMEPAEIVPAHEGHVGSLEKPGRRTLATGLRCLGTVRAALQPALITAGVAAIAFARDSSGGQLFE